MLHKGKVFKGDAIDGEKNLIELAVIEALLCFHHSKEKDEKERVIMNEPFLFRDDLADLLDK